MSPNSACTFPVVRACTLVRSADIHNTVGIDVKGHFDPEMTTRCGCWLLVVGVGCWSLLLAVGCLLFVVGS